MSLERQAERLAQGRKERVTSAHLLAAMAMSPGAAATLLGDRGLGGEDLLRAARAVSDDDGALPRLAMKGAKEVAERMRAPEPLALHLLIWLVGERRTAAHRALDQCGVDLHRLRLAAMNLALGMLGRQPIPTALEQRAAKSADPTTRLAPGEALGVGGRPLTGRAASRPPPTARRRAQLVSPADLRDRELRARAKSEPPAKAPAEAAAPPPPLATIARLPMPRPPERELEERFGLARKRFPLLARFGKNLTLAAARGELDSVVGRDAEVERVLDVLSKRFANNPCVVGPSGVGKTRVVHGVAQRLAESDGAARLVIELGAAALVAGTGVRGGVAQRMQALRREVELGEGRIVLFFDELHQLFLGDGGEELTSELKLAIAQGELPIIGATTREEYARAIESDAALARRFTLIEVDEPSREDAFLVLSALAPKFEVHHGVKYAEEALASAISWSTQYVTGRALPDKAVSVLDLSGARARRRGQTEVTPSSVAEVIAELSGVPAERLLESDGERLLSLERCLAARVVGHEECLRAIARAVRRNAAGLGGKRPIGTFLLLGPTGVGKTETAKALAEALFFSEQAMTRIDLSEYSEPHAVARLIGAPPGYVGHEAGGQLTEAVRRRPYQVVLLDELEKAHEEVLQSFLALFDEGRMTDGRGRTVDFTNTLIVMTSNLGAADVSTSAKVGFQRRASTTHAGDYRERVIERVRGALAPELFNRIDEVLVFEPLVREQVCQIAERMLLALGERLREARGVDVDFDQSTIDCLIAAGGVDLALGARPMRRTIARLVEGPLAEMVLAGELGPGDVARVRGSGREIQIQAARGARAAGAAE